MRLIILDDEQRFANFLALLAREQGWTVAAASNGYEFRRLCADAIPEAILLDLHLRDTDGIEQLHFLHSISYAGPIVLISGFDARVLAAAEQVGRSLGLTIATTLQKPLRAAEVREALAIVARSVAHPALFDQTATSRAQSGGELQPIDVFTALEAGQMELYLQPIVAAGERAVAQLESLIRWHHAGKLLMPDAFVPVSERDQSVIDRLTMWVVDHAVSCYRELSARGFSIPVAVNISGANLRSLDFPDWAAACVADAGIPASAIVFEITESVAVDNAWNTTEVLTRLRLKGFELAIDDLGMGHSSLNALRRMPFSAIKIDKTFVDGLLTSRDSLAIVTSIVQLARSMRLTSVAEGVETVEAARVLTELGIDCLQGYLFSRPLPFGELVQWLQSWEGTEQRAAIRN